RIRDLEKQPHSTFVSLHFPNYLLNCRDLATNLAVEYGLVSRNTSFVAADHSIISIMQDPEFKEDISHPSQLSRDISNEINEANQILEELDQYELAAAPSASWFSLAARRISSLFCLPAP